MSLMSLGLFGLLAPMASWLLWPPGLIWPPDLLGLLGLLASLASWPFWPPVPPALLA